MSDDVKIRSHIEYLIPTDKSGASFTLIFDFKILPYLRFLIRFNYNSDVAELFICPYTATNCIADSN